MAKKERKKGMTKTELEQALLDNFINLQKVLTNLSVKFDELSSNMSKLLQIFEISAKNFAEKYSEEKDMTKSDKALINKLDALLDQNKTISKGILLMEERIKGKYSDSILQGAEPNLRGSFRSKPLSSY